MSTYMTLHMTELNAVATDVARRAPWTFVSEAGRQLDHGHALAGRYAR
jgi:hypothetical protein